MHNVAALIPRDRHLLVPINVQALVVPHTEMPDAGVKTKSNRVPNIKNIREPNIAQSAITTYPQRANLKSDFQREKLQTQKTRNIGAFPKHSEYTSSDPQTSGLDSGIHLFWSLPDALLNGELKQTSQSILDNFQYQDPDDLVPEEFIPCDEGFSHPITFREAVENRVEFTTDDQPEGNLNDTLSFKQLPDLWVIVRIENKVNFKAWVVDSMLLEVSTLASFNPQTRKSDIAELTAIGPNKEISIGLLHMITQNKDSVSMTYQVLERMVLLITWFVVGTQTSKTIRFTWMKIPLKKLGLITSKKN